MKVALVHDYLQEFGGAERVLEALSETFPDAPIYTAFYVKDSVAYQKLKHKKIVSSWAQQVPFFATKLHSPLRFLAPLIWNWFDFSEYDVVITSASWYVTKGVVRDDKKKTIEICYCHTPPRYLYGYPTAVEWQKYWPVRVYATIVNHFMRLYDFNAAQRVTYFIANSKETAGRIKKFYRKSSTVIYPPVSLCHPEFISGSNNKEERSRNKFGMTNEQKPYYLVVSRIVGGKGLRLAIEAANKLGFNLKVIGKAGGYSGEGGKMRSMAKANVEFLGFVPDEELADLYANAKGFFALATHEDFGITPVEAMMAGTPVIAYKGGGYLETVQPGKTGVFFEKSTTESLIEAIKKFETMNFNREAIKKYARKFSKERFEKEIKEFVKRVGN